MSVFDIRGNVAEVSSIVFADDVGRENVNHCYELKKWSVVSNMVAITDADHEVGETNDYVVVSSKEHAEHLIKALNKAVSLGWLK